MTEDSSEKATYTAPTSHKSKMVRNSPSPTLTASYRGQSAQRPRPRIAAMETGPGPAKYALPGTTGSQNHDATKKRTPAFTFGAITKQSSSLITTSKSPGPVYLVSPSVTRTGPDGSPAYSLHVRPKDLTRSRSPGPAVYNTGGVVAVREARPPAYSFGVRTVLPQTKPKPYPSPNTYSLPSLLGAGTVGKTSLPAYTITGRSKVGSFHQDLKKTPGPGSYHVVDATVTGRKSPSYSLHLRTELVTDKSLRPGPGSHKVVAQCKQPPAYSFGVKHSQYIASYLDMVV